MSTPRGIVPAHREETRRPPRLPRRNRIMSERHRTQLFREFEQWCWNVKRWSKTTQATYFQRARAANRWLEENRETSICWAKPKDLKAYLFQCRPDARIRNQVRNALVAFGEFLVEKEYAEVNPALALPILPVKRGLPAVLDRDQVRRVTAVAKTLGPREEALVFTLLYTAMRREEVRTLEWTSFEPNLRADSVFIRFTAKGDKDRSIPLHEDARRALLRWREDCPDARWLFPSDKRPGLPVNSHTIGKWINQIGRAAGIRLYPHIFRHTFATAEIDSGVDLRQVQEWLGHASPTTTSIYTHVHSKSLREALEKLNFDNLPGAQEGMEKPGPRGILGGEG